MTVREAQSPRCKRRLGNTVSNCDGCAVNAKAWRDQLQPAFPNAIWVSWIGHKLAKVSREVETKLVHLEALIKYTRTFIRYNGKKWAIFLRLTAGRKGSFGKPTSHGWEDPFEQALFWQSRIHDFLSFLKDAEDDGGEATPVPVPGPVPVPVPPPATPASQAALPQAATYRIPQALLTTNSRPPASSASKKTVPPPAPAPRKTYRASFIELLTEQLTSLKVELDMIADEHEKFCELIRSFQVQGRAYTMYANYRETASWLSRLSDKYPKFAAFWNTLYLEWKSYEDREDLRDMFTFFRNIRLLDPRQTATVPYDAAWPKDPNIRALLWRWHQQEGLKCSQALAASSPAEYWRDLQGYGNLPQWALVAIQTPMSSADAERAFNFMHYVQQEHAPHMTDNVLKTRCLLAFNSRYDSYIPVRRARKRDREEDASTVATAVVELDENQALLDPNLVPADNYVYINDDVPELLSPEWHFSDDGDDF